MREAGVNKRSQLVKLLSECPCEGGEERGNCPYRRFGKCKLYEELDYCTIVTLAEHLIANGVTVQEQVRDCHWATEQAYKNGYAKGVEDGKRGATEVAHGLWQVIRSKADVAYTCSQCGMTYCEGDPTEKPFKYCPECGSKNE